MSSLSTWAEKGRAGHSLLEILVISSSFFLGSLQNYPVGIHLAAEKGISRAP